jgi:ferredoxin-NADP reductase/DMSO/TMAO reductase YedYZ heme-binding membrane subunit
MAVVAGVRAGVRRPGFAPDLVGSAAAFSLLVVAALWVRDGGVQQIARGGFDGITALGRITGLLSADLLLVQVLMMARVPWIERAYGQDRLARVHRLAGFTSLNLLLVHTALVTIGYAGSGRVPLLREAWDLVVTYPGMLLATAGTALLVLVAVTSVRAARRRLRYESWHLLHLYAYLGAGLALPHQLWTGADFLDSRAATLYRWTAYGCVAGAVLVFRVGVPLWRSARHRLTVASVVPEAPGVVSVYLRGRDLDRLPVRAGQFFHWRFLDGPGWTRANPYSLSASPRPDLLRITVKEAGDGSRRVARLRPGTRVLVEGPYGRLTGDARTSRRMTLIACGVGITPLRALLEEQPYRRGDAVLLYRARTADDLVFRKELDALARSRGVRLAYLVGPRAAERSWRPRGAPQLGELVPDIAGHDVFLCGPRPWMDAAARAARACGVPPERIHLEEFGW